MKAKIFRLALGLMLVMALAGVFTIHAVRTAPAARASGCVQTTWIETGISSSASGAHTSVTAYLQELVDKTDHTYCGSLRTRLYWQFNALNYCDSFGTAVDGQYGVGQYGVTYTGVMCSGNIMGQPSGNLYSGSKAETCGTVDGWANTDGEHAGHSGGCF